MRRGGVSVMALVALGWMTARAQAELPTAPQVTATSAGIVVEAQLTGKKDEYMLAKRSARPSTRPVPKVGVAPRPIISLFNTWTHEWIAVDAKKPVVPAALVNRLLRCHFTNADTDMDKRLVPTVVAAAVTFKVDRVNIVSGFRAPKYNLNLRKKGHQVARDSQHTHGNAIDFRLPGVGTMALHAWAVARKLGGVGLYIGSSFVHMDTDKIRYWNGE